MIEPAGAIWEARDVTATHDRYLSAVSDLVTTLQSVPHTRLDTAVPACPGWTVADAVRHLCGMAVDLAAGRTDGAGSPEWTARQVAERRSTPLVELLPELVEAAQRVPIDATEGSGPNLYWDLVIHTADMHEALALPMVATSTWHPVLDAVVTWRSAHYRAQGQLVALTGSGCATLGSGGPPVTVAVDDYELFRALSSRRSRSQMEAWPWTGDPAPHLTAVPMFGERLDDQPVPPA
jgi:uncharacterized protein (TIGR03083 family)